jgi:hypothetical protein
MQFFFPMRYTRFAYPVLLEVIFCVMVHEL